MVREGARGSGAAVDIFLTEPKPWSDRGNAPTNAGVYVIKKKNEIVYIGETKGRQGLFRRLREFNNAATNGTGPHAGGRTFHAKFGVINPAEITFQYHDAVAAGIEEGIRVPYVLYVERLLIWRFAVEHKRQPKCNSLGERRG